MNRITDILLNGLLYKTLWKRNLFTKIIYMLLPFILILIFGLILYFEDALNMGEAYGFFADYTNCYMLSYIFFFMYFVYGMFLPWLDNNVDRFGKVFSANVYPRYRNIINKIRIHIAIFSTILSLLAIPFILTALNTGDKNWYSKLNSFELIYYSVLIISAWVMSAKLFSNIMVQMVALYKYIQKMTGKFDLYNPDKKCGCKDLFNTIIASMGFGVYFIIAVGMILFSDYRAHKYYGLTMVGYTYNWLIISITVVLAVIYYSIIILTYMSLNKSVRNQLNSKLNRAKKDFSNNKLMFIRNISLSVINPHDICVFILTVLFPGIAAIVQILSPFS